MKLAAAILTGVLFLFFVSCSDSVDPKTSPQEDYVFYCIINADTTFQTAYLSKSYDVSGTNPYLNSSDPAVTGANIKVDLLNITTITSNGKTKLDTTIAATYQFHDASVAREDSSRYKDGFHFYSTNSVNIKSNYIHDVPKTVVVTASLSNGKVLKASTETIPVGDLFFDKYLYSYPPEETVKMVDFKWSFFSSKNSISKYYFIPSLIINYSKMENGVLKPYSIKVPYMTSYANGEETRLYPKLIKLNYISFNKEYIKEALDKISEGAPLKSAFYIHNMKFTINVLDKNVASYQAASSTYNDEFSVRLDAADVSNVTGGFGLFGLYTSKVKEIIFDKDFIEKLGYNYQP